MVEEAKAYNEADQEMIQAVVTATMGSGAGLLLPPGPNISCTEKLIPPLSYTPTLDPPQ